MRPCPLLNSRGRSSTKQQLLPRNNCRSGCGGRRTRTGRPTAMRMNEFSGCSLPCPLPHCSLSPHAATGRALQVGHVGAALPADATAAFTLL